MALRWEKNKAAPRFTTGDIVTNDFVHCLIYSIDDASYDVYSIIMLDEYPPRIYHKIYLNDTWREA